MRIYYEGKDITDSVQVAGCVVKDYSGGKTDSISLTLEQAQEWYAWGPKTGDRIEIWEDGWRSGGMYLAAVYPEENKFRIAATAAKPGIGQKRNKSYEHFTLEDLMKAGAEEAGMKSGVYGLEPGTVYPFLLRDCEGCGAFLQRVAKWEGAMLKCWDGKLLMIGTDWAQKLPAMETMELSARQPGMIFRRRDGEKLRMLTVSCGMGQGWAIDQSAAVDGLTESVYLPATDTITANRWARGLLLSRNREKETLEIESRLHLNWTAMCRVDVTGQTEANGEWLCDEAEHDLINRTSKAKFLRCVGTII